MPKPLRLIRAGGATVAAIGLIALASFWLPKSDSTVSAAEITAKGAGAVANVSSIHIRAQMRTYPSDNFSQIDPETDLVPIELWRQFGDQAKWRIDKPGSE